MRPFAQIHHITRFRCAYCGADVGERCRQARRGTGQSFPMTDFHLARTQAAYGPDDTPADIASERRQDVSKPPEMSTAIRLIKNEPAPRPEPSMSNLVRLDVGKKAPADLSAQLREIADAVDRGEITSLVASMVRGDEFSFVYGASIRDALELATILQARCIDRYRD